MTIDTDCIWLLTTRSLDDTEVLRRKYVEAKQSYEEKVCYSCLCILYKKNCIIIVEMLQHRYHNRILQLHPPALLAQVPALTVKCRY